MRDTDYAYAVARVRSNECNLLTKQDIDSLMAAPDCDACLSRLAGKGWGGQGRRFENENAMIDAQCERMWSLISEIAPDLSVFDSLRIPNDYHNLKAAIKAFVTGQEPDRFFITPYTIEPSVITEAIKERNYSLLPEHMQTAAQDAFRTLLEQRNGQLCDIIIDKASLEASLENAKKYGGTLLELAKLSILRSNIKIAWRCSLQKRSANFIAKALAEGCSPDTAQLTAASLEGKDAVIELLHSIDSGLEKALSEEGVEGFDKACDNKRTQLLTKAKYTPLGVDPLIAYMIACENEIRNVRLIFTGKRNGIPDERIRTMLREV